MGFWKIMILLLAVFVLTNFFLILAHEQAHVMIFKYYGIDSTIETGIFGARVNPAIDVSQSDSRFVYGLHAINEAVGYQIMAVYNSLIVFCYFSFLAFKKLDEAKNQTT